MTEKELVELCDLFTEEWPNAAYGPAHIVLDDYNLEPDDIAWCLTLTTASLTGDLWGLDEDQIGLLYDLRFYENNPRAELVATKVFLTSLLCGLQRSSP